MICEICYSKHFRNLYTTFQHTHARVSTSKKRITFILLVSLAFNCSIRIFYPFVRWRDISRICISLTPVRFFRMRSLHSSSQMPLSFYVFFSFYFRRQLEPYICSSHYHYYYKKQFSYNGAANSRLLKPYEERLFSPL